MKTEENKLMIKKQLRAALCVVALSGLVLTGCSEDKSADLKKVTESAAAVTGNVTGAVEEKVVAAVEAAKEKVDSAVEKAEEVVTPEAAVAEVKPEPVVEAKSEAVAEPAVETAASSDQAADDLPQYVVECPEGAASAKACKVDKNTYVGWRSYSVNCQVCHGGSGLGSTFAPNLMDRFNQQDVDYARFREVVTNGFTGQMGAMPAWDKNKGVMKDLDNLYRYLQARADDKLPKGRPTRMK